MNRKDDKQDGLLCSFTAIMSLLSVVTHLDQVHLSVIEKAMTPNCTAVMGTAHYSDFKPVHKILNILPLTLFSEISADQEGQTRDSMSEYLHITDKFESKLVLTFY